MSIFRVEPSLLSLLCCCLPPSISNLPRTRSFRIPSHDKDLTYIQPKWTPQNNLIPINQSIQVGWIEFSITQVASFDCPQLNCLKLVPIIAANKHKSIKDSGSSSASHIAVQLHFIETYFIRINTRVFVSNTIPRIHIHSHIYRHQMVNLNFNYGQSRLLLTCFELLSKVIHGHTDSATPSRTAGSLVCMQISIKNTFTHLTNTHAHFSPFIKWPFHSFHDIFLIKHYTHALFILVA